MADNASQVESTDAQSPRTQPIASAAEQTARLRLWPGVVAVALLWTAMLVPPMLYPESPKSFMPLFMGIQASYLLAIIWWLFASRTPWRDRLVGLVVAVGGLMLGRFVLFHESLEFMPLMFFIGPWLLTAMVGTMLLTYPLGWKRSRWAALGVALVGLVATASLRYQKVDSAFNASFLPRWEQNSEERLLASLNNQKDEPPSATENQLLELGPSDWPGFRGALRNGHVQDGSLAADWQDRQPEELWRREIGPGWSSFAVVDKLAFTQEQRGDEECVVAYDIATGKQIWSTGVEGRFEESVAGPGPRATPTFTDGRLYATGAAGAVLCLEASSGEIVWQQNLVADSPRESAPEWGFSSSPASVTTSTGEQLAIVYAGNAKPKPEESPTAQGVIAYNAATGEKVWQAGVGYHSYSSPHVATLGGVEQVLMATNLGLESLDPTTGARLWFCEWDIADFPRSIQPLVVDEETVIFSAGYDSGTQALRVELSDEAWAVETLWHSHDLEPYFNDLVLHNGHLYGIHKKFLVCLDLATGESKWPRKVKRKAKFGNGQLVLDAETGMLLLTAETTGEVLLIEANPETLVLRGRFKALQPDTNWNHPVVAQGRLFVRNGVEAACFELPQAKLVVAKRGR